MNIEEIQVRDIVIATDPETGETEEKEVVETYINETEELIHIWVDGEEIITTPTHPFYVPEKGWTSAVGLKAGDQLQLVNGEYVTVEAVQHELLEESVKVYNFQVKDFHTYYVGENNSVLVHNTCSMESKIRFDPNSINVSDKKMYQLGDHYEKHGRSMGYASKKEYNKAAHDFVKSSLSDPNVEIYQGQWNGKGQLNGTNQIIIRNNGKQVILDKDTGQIIDFYDGIESRGLINIERLY